MNFLRMSSLYTLLLATFYLSILTEGKGNGNGSGGRGSGGRGIRSGGGRLTGKQGVLIAGAGAAGYAYASINKGHRYHSDPIENPALSSGGAGDIEDADYRTQEYTHYSRREGLGMSAIGILALIFGIIAGGTLAYFCYMVGVPLWKDRQQRNQSRLEGHPLQETPSTATPSP